MFSGTMVAIITPFSDGQVDYETLTELLEFQLESGTDGNRTGRDHGGIADPDL